MLTRARTALAVALLVTAGLAFADPGSAATEQAIPQPGQGFFNSALPLTLTGDARASALGGTAYVTGGDAATRVTLTAASLDVERHAWTVTRVVNPANGNDVYAHYEEQAPTRASFADVAGHGENVRPDLLLVAAAASPDAATVTLDAAGNARLTVTGDEARRLGPWEDTPDVETDESGEWRPHHDVLVPHLTARATPDVVRVEGNFTLVAWGADFRLAGADGASETVRTGRHDESSTAAVTESEVAFALVHVTRGVLEVTHAAAAEVLAPHLVVDVRGEGAFPAAVGGYRAGDTKYEATGQDVRFTGDAHLESRLVDGRTDRALVDLSGRLAHVSLPALPAPAPGDDFLDTPAGRVAATSTGALVLLVGAAVLAGSERRETARRFLRAPVHRFRWRARSREDRVEDAVTALVDGDDARAVRLLERLLAETPADVVLLVDYGCALERLGRVRAARDAFESAVQEDPGNAEAHYYYARVLARLNLSASALPHLQRAVTLDASLVEMAVQDEGFHSLADHPSFVALMR